MEEQKTCVVTGGAGFIGSHLCDRLLDRGLRVICIDNLITGKEDNIAEAIRNPLFTFLKKDVTQPLTDAFDSVDYIFHMASPASVIDYQSLPEETALVNSVGSHHMLALASQKHARFLFASTSEVYGNPKEHPQKETYWGNVNPNGLRSCYDEAKRFGEMLTMLFVRKYGVDGRIVRIFNTYGPRMRKTDGRVVSNFINQALEGKSLTIYGDGFQTRSFCFVSDLVQGIMAMMFSNNTKGEVVNIGNPEEYRVLDFAQKILSLSGSSSPLSYQALPEDDPVQRRPDIEKAKKLFGWQPSVSVDDGLKKTIAYYKDL